MLEVERCNLSNVNREVALQVVFRKTARDDPDGCLATSVASETTREHTPIEHLAADMERLLTSEEHADVEFEVIENANEEIVESVAQQTEWQYTVEHKGGLPYQLCGGGASLMYPARGYMISSHNVATDERQRRINVSNNVPPETNRPPRGTMMRAHKAVLVARVPYFERLFASGMREAETNRIRVEDVDADSFRQFLLFVYAGKLPENVETKARVYLPLSEKYDVGILKQSCEETLERQLEKRNLVQTMVWADLYRCEKLKETCMKKYNVWRGEFEVEDLNSLQQYPQLMFEILSYRTKGFLF